MVIIIQSCCTCPGRLCSFQKVRTGDQGEWKLSCPSIHTTHNVRDLYPTTRTRVLSNQALKKLGSHRHPLHSRYLSNGLLAAQVSPVERREYRSSALNPISDVGRRGPTSSSVNRDPEESSKRSHKFRRGVQWKSTMVWWNKTQKPQTPKVVVGYKNIFVLFCLRLTGTCFHSFFILFVLFGQSCFRHCQINP